MGLTAKLKAMVQNDSPVLRLALEGYNHLPFLNHFHLRGNTLNMGSVQLSGCTLDVRGSGNTITIGRGSRLKNCLFHISGNGNHITLGDFVSGSHVEFWIEDNGGTITVGTHTSFAGFTHLACIEGSSISIGEDCMFSANIVLRTGDSHSILDLEGSRINPSAPIAIGDHVWVGNTVNINKGVTLGSHSIVGTGSIVTKGCEAHEVLAGNPARVVKTGVTWDRERI